MGARASEAAVEIDRLFREILPDPGFRGTRIIVAGARCRCVGLVLEGSCLSKNWEISLNAQPLFPSKGSSDMSGARSTNYARHRAI